MMAERTRVAILISGRGSNMAALIAAAEKPDAGYAVALVAANDPAAAGLEIAAAAGIPVWSRSHRGMDRAAFDALIDAELHRHRIELIALAGYMRLLSPAFVHRWRGRILNIHPSLLPLYKGLDTHGRAIAAGDAEAGCSVHIVTPELDDGPVLGQARVPIHPGDTADTLAARILVEEHRLYPELLSAYARTVRKERPA